MQTYMAEAFRQKPYRSIQNMGSAQLRGNGLLNYPRRNHVDSQIDWREDPTITPLRRLLRNRIYLLLKPRRSIEWQQCAFYLANSLENELFSEAASKVEYVNREKQNQQLQILIQRKLNDVNLSQQQIHHLTSTTFPSCAVMPTSSISQDCRDSGAPVTLDQVIAANADYNMAIPDSKSQSSFFKGSLLNGYSKRVADLGNPPYAKNMVSSSGLRPIARKMDPRLEQFPVVATHSNGDGCSGRGAFDNGPCFSGCTSQYISQLSVRSHLKRKHLDGHIHSNEDESNQKKFRSLRGSDQTSYPMGFPSELGETSVSLDSNLQIPRQVPERISKTPVSFPGMIFNAPSSTLEDSQRLQELMLEPHPFQQHLHHSYRQFDTPSETQLRAYMATRARSCCQIPSQNALEQPQHSMVQSNGKSSTGTSRHENLSKTLQLSSEHQILGSCIDYQSLTVPSGKRKVNHAHSTASKGHTCDCLCRSTLSSHFDNSQFPDCCISRPVQRSDATGKHQLGLRKFEQGVLSIDDRNTGGKNSDCFYGSPPPSKRLKAMNPSSHFSPKVHTHPLSAPSLDQCCPPKGLPNSQNCAESPASVNSEVVRVNTEPVTSPTKAHAEISEIRNNIAANPLTVTSKPAQTKSPDLLISSNEEIEPIGISEIRSDVTDDFHGPSVANVPVLSEEPTIGDEEQKMQIQIKSDKVKSYCWVSSKGEIEPPGISEIRSDVTDDFHGLSVANVPVLSEEPTIGDEEQELQIQIKSDQAQPNIQSGFGTLETDHEEGLKYDPSKPMIWSDCSPDLMVSLNEVMEPTAISEDRSNVMDIDEGPGFFNVPLLSEEPTTGNEKQAMQITIESDQLKPNINSGLRTPETDHEKGVKFDSTNREMESGCIFPTAKDETKTENNCLALTDGDGTPNKSKDRKTESACLADFFTAEQMKEHILSLRRSNGQDVAQKKISRYTSENSCQLCLADNLLFAPEPIYCSLCGTRIKNGVLYYCTQAENGAKLCCCTSCYKMSRGGNITLCGFTISKANLDKEKNDKETEESWVQCDRCEGWQHQICALFNDKRDVEEKAKYICPICYLKDIEANQCTSLPKDAFYGAKDLPSSKLSNHIEQRLFSRLEQERKERAIAAGKNFGEVPGAEDLVVRVVSSIDKQLKVNKQFLDFFQDHNYPMEFPYRSKMILLFQKIEGVDVCLFGMHVQEFGSECGQPNQRSVYISYLDSVKYFRPDIATSGGEALRTFIYNEIIIGYLDYCKKQGFTKCYLWSCPPLKGEDYILYCHPKSQKTPKTDKLRQWYRSMLTKAAKESIVVELTNIYDHFFIPTGKSNTKVTAARLPYFDGDYWSTAAGDLIRNIVQESGGNFQKLTDLVTKRTLKAMGHINPSVAAVKEILMMQKLGQTIFPKKEDFLMVHLHFCCSFCQETILSGRRWVCHQCKNFQLCDRCHDMEQNPNEPNVHTLNSKEKHVLSQVVNNVPVDTEDKDAPLDNNLFENRHSFLSFCQTNHYQFDTLRRAKHSSMMILHHLHNYSGC